MKRLTFFIILMYQYLLLHYVRAALYTSFCIVRESYNEHHDRHKIKLCISRSYYRSYIQLRDMLPSYIIKNFCKKKIFFFIYACMNRQAHHVLVKKAQNKEEL